MGMGAPASHQSAASAAAPHTLSGHHTVNAVNLYVNLDQPKSVAYTNTCIAAVHGPVGSPARPWDGCRVVRPIECCVC
jgi:hypothetical protein